MLDRRTVPETWLVVVLALVALACRGDAPGRPRRVHDGSARSDGGGGVAGEEPPPVAVCAGADCEPFLVAELPTHRGIALTLGAGFAYVGALYDDAIYRVPLQPGAPPVILYRSPGADVSGIEVRGDALRWSSIAAGAIYEAPLSGTGPIRVVADGLPGIWGFASSDDSIYWMDFAGSAPGMVWKRATEGGPSTGLGRDPGSRVAVSLLLDGPGGDILYSDRTSRVMRMPAGGGPATVWADLGGRRQSAGLAEDEAHVYVAAQTSNDVMRIDRRTGTAEIFARSEHTLAAVAVDETTVYWLNYADPVAVRGKRK